MQDPGNAGAIVRTAEAFGATGAVFLKGTVNPYNPKCVRGSAGSVFRVPLIASIEADEILQARENFMVRRDAARAETGERCESGRALRNYHRK